MSNSINLLVPERESKERKQRIRYLRTASLSFMFLIVAVSVGLFLLILASPLPAVRQEESAAKAKLQTLQNTSAKLYLTKERLSSIQGILKKRPAFEELLTRIASELPTDATVTAIEVTSQSFSVTVESHSLLSINSLIERMRILKSEDKLFKSVTLSDLSYAEKTPDYSVSIKTKL